MVGILGTGHYLPKKIVTNDDWAKQVDTSDEWIVSRTGIRERHFISGDENSVTMSLASAKMALKNANVLPEELGLVICATLTADSVVPGLAGDIIRALHIQCPAFDLNAACSGFIFSIAVAQKMFAGKPILVIATEHMSKIIDVTDRSTCVLFGDGSGAAVIGEGENAHEILSCDIMSYPDEKHSLDVPGLNKRVDGAVVLSSVAMNGGEVYRFATRVLAKNIKAALDQLNLSTDDVRWFIPHQANIRIIETAAKSLGLSMDRFFVNVDHVGNTSCASVAIALNELVLCNTLQKGDIIVIGAFGGGLTAGTMVIRW